jgi:molecular chaperone HtpG
MEKINKAQAFQNNEKAPSYMLAKKQLELNPSHPVMKKMLDSLKESDDNTLSATETEYADLMFHMALLNSGFLLDDPDTLTNPLEKLIKVGFGLTRDAECEEIEVEISETEEEDEEDDTFFNDYEDGKGGSASFQGKKTTHYENEEEFYASKSNQAR